MIFRIFLILKKRLNLKTTFQIYKNSIGSLFKQRGLLTYYGYNKAENNSFEIKSILISENWRKAQNEIENS